MAEFCLKCGAGIGKFRREGEGTCPACDPMPPKGYVYIPVTDIGVDMPGLLAVPIKEIDNAKTGK